MSLTNEIVIIRLAANNKYVPNRMLAGALPHTPLGELTALPRPHRAGLWGGAPREREEGRTAKGGRGGHGRGGSPGMPKSRVGRLF